MSAAGDFACVLDASALLALLQDEPGAEVVEPVLESAVISAVNWSEVLQKSLDRGVEVVDLGDELGALGLTIAPFTAGDAEATASLRRPTAHLGLSLADRACLALAGRLRTDAFTTDQTWSEVGSIPVRVIR
jgi:ribonuclease VapC